MCLLLQIKRTENLALHPRYFGSDMQDVVLEQLKSKVEGKCSGRYGYCVAVVCLSLTAASCLDESTGVFPECASELAVFHPLPSVLADAIM